VSAADAVVPLPLPFVLATGNPDKAREILEIFTSRVDAPLAAYALEPTGYLVAAPDEIAAAVDALGDLPADIDVEETGETLEDNARIKAEALRAASGVSAIADDTGLEVHALDGAPGVRSARYAGETATYVENYRKLLAELRGMDDALRGARFATVAVAALADGRVLEVRGEVQGRITTEPRGRGGFGYDPVFVPAECDGRTFAEMAPSEKHALSHRGRAFRALADVLARRAQAGPHRDHAARAETQAD